MKSVGGNRSTIGGGLTGGLLAGLALDAIADGNLNSGTITKQPSETFDLVVFLDRIAAYRECTVTIGGTAAAMLSGWVDVVYPQNSSYKSDTTQTLTVSALAAGAYVLEVTATAGPFAITRTFNLNIPQEFSSEFSSEFD